MPLSRHLPNLKLSASKDAILASAVLNANAETAASALKETDAVTNVLVHHQRPKAQDLANAVLNANVAIAANALKETDAVISVLAHHQRPNASVHVIALVAINASVIRAKSAVTNALVHQRNAAPREVASVVTNANVKLVDKTAVVAPVVARPAARTASAPRKSAKSNN